jgi:hypothetical protein
MNEVTNADRNVQRAECELPPVNHHGFHGLISAEI